MNHKAKLNLLTPLLALAVGGCVSALPSPDSSGFHPANSQAAQSSEPLPVPTLMSLTNLVLVKSIAGSAPEHQHGQEQRETTPKTEGKK